MLVGSMDSSATTLKRPWLWSPLAGARPWLLFVSAILASAFVHELGHCAVAWLHGYPAIPTPAKEYILKPMTEVVQNRVSLGGILGSVAALLAGGFWLHCRPSTASSALLAGAMTVPGAYTLRFLLQGRGHDGAEFQEAQAALGLSYSGHAIDRLFYALFVMAAVFVVLADGRPTLRLVCRLLVGAVAAVAVMVLLQSVNNAVFDPLLQPKPKQNQPTTGGPGVGAGRAQLGRQSSVRSADAPDFVVQLQWTVSALPQANCLSVGPKEPTKARRVTIVVLEVAHRLDSSEACRPRTYQHKGPRCHERGSGSLGKS